MAITWLPAGSKRKVCVLSVVTVALLCVSCGGSSGGAPPAPDVTVQMPGLMTVGRWAPAVTLKSGDVPVLGGLGSLAAKVLASGELHHSKTDTFTQVANQLAVAAGSPCLAALDTAELFDPKSGAFTPTAWAMSSARSFASELILPSRRGMRKRFQKSSVEGLEGEVRPSRSDTMGCFTAGPRPARE